MTAIPIIISLFAVGLAAASWAWTRHEYRRTILLDLHRDMTGPEASEGRRTLYQLHSSGQDFSTLKSENADAWDSINHALSLYNILGLYTTKRWVSADTVDELWGRAIVHITPAAKDFMAVRTETEGWTTEDPLWMFWAELMDDAQKNRPTT